MALEYFKHIVSFLLKVWFCAEYINKENQWPKSHKCTANLDLAAHPNFVCLRCSFTWIETFPQVSFI